MTVDKKTGLVVLSASVPLNQGFDGGGDDNPPVKLSREATEGSLACPHCGQTPHAAGRGAMLCGRCASPVRIVAGDPA